MEKFLGKKNIAVFISGRGSNLKSLINYSKKKNSLIKIMLVISNNTNAKGLKIANNFKIKNSQRFLTKGDKVKFTVQFKGREMQHTNLGFDLMKRIINDTASLGKIEVEPVFDATHIAYAISAISKMPLDTNVLNMTIMANDMPFVGRG